MPKAFIKITSIFWIDIDTQPSKLYCQRRSTLSFWCRIFFINVHVLWKPPFQCWFCYRHLTNPKLRRFMSPKVSVALSVDLQQFYSFQYDTSLRIYLQSVCQKISVQSVALRMEVHSVILGNNSHDLGQKSLPILEIFKTSVTLNRIEHAKVL